MEQSGSAEVVAGRDPSPRDRGVDDRFVTSDGTALHVRQSGPPDAPLTVFFVHGWTQDETCWNPIVSGMPDDVRIVRHDHRGHGASAPAREGTRTLEQIADDLAELIADRAPEGPIVLVGHSMGGMTIMALAERHPALVDERVAAVAFVATSSGQMDRLTLGLPGVAGRSVPRVERIFKVLLEKRRRDTLPGNPKVLSPAARWLVFGKKAKQADVLDVTCQALRAHPSSIAGFRDAIGAHDRRVALAALRGKPTVVLVGDRDRLCPVGHAKVIADELPNTYYVLFPGAGHMLMYERADEVTARIGALVKAAVPR
ncbi:MAG: alpha/beta fold hydrolase [Pseudonocardiaceae bacterium]